MNKNIILTMLMLFLLSGIPVMSQSIVLPAPKLNTGYTQSTTHYTISTPQGVQHGTIQMQTQDLQQMQRIQQFNQQQEDYYQQQINRTQPVIIMDTDIKNNNSHSSQPNTMYRRTQEVQKYPTSNEEVRRLLLKKSGGN